MTKIRRRVHVLVVTTTGGVLVRLAVERAVRALGWVLAWSPADADVLAVCGSPAGAELDAVEQLWRQVPGPRARVQLDGTVGAADSLRRTISALDDRAVQDELSRDADADADAASMDHDGMNHDGMSMTGPAGIPLAEGSDDDRDGLEMDAWHLVLGAGLPGWPAGLVLRATLHGDVVTALEVLGAPDPLERADATMRAALLLDAAATVLELAGWSAAAGAARRSQDDLVDGRGPGQVAAEVERLARRVRRSALLRWSLEGPRRRDTDLSLGAGRLVRPRVIDLLESAAALLRDRARPTPLPGTGDLAGLPELAVGQELAMLRLLVASLALDARATADA